MKKYKLEDLQAASAETVISSETPNPVQPSGRKQRRQTEKQMRHEEQVKRSQERAAVRAQTTGQGIVRLMDSLRGWFKQIFSNLRFSLTLRIAIHYSGQLLKTTLPMLLVFSIVFAIAQIPSVNAAFDSLEAIVPAEGQTYSASQLTGLPVNRAYYLDAPLSEDFNGFTEQVNLAFSDFRHQKVFNSCSIAVPRKAVLSQHFRLRVCCMSTPCSSGRLSALTFSA